MTKSSASILCRKELFIPIVLTVLGYVMFIILAVDGRVKHDTDKNKSEKEKWFQIRDVDTHELWAFFSLAFGLGGTMGIITTSVSLKQK